MRSSESLLINVILFAIVIFLLLCLFCKTHLNYWKDRGVPYVKPFIFFGNVKDHYFGLKNINVIYEEIYKELNGHNYGGLFELTEPTLLIRKPELAQRILIKDFKYFHSRGCPIDYEGDPFTANLFSISGEKWRSLRNKITPTFTTGKLKTMFDEISNCGEELIKYIDGESKLGNALDCEPLMINFAFDVVASCAFGLDLSKNRDITKMFRFIVNKSFNNSRRQVLRLLFLIYAPKTAKRLGIRIFDTETAEFILTLVKETLKYREKNNVIRNDFIHLLLSLQKQEQDGKLQFVFKDEDHNPEDDIIDQMEHATKLEDDTSNQGKQKVFLTDSIIAAQCFTFLTGGSETVSITLSFCLFCLTQNPDVQNTLQNEIDSVLTHFNQQWSYEAVKEMKYLDQVIQETTRQYPAIPVLYRECTRNYKIPDSEVVIEKGTRVLIPIRAIQNDPEHYESPEIFDPSRFANNNYKPNRIYMPFGDGPRICIALRFAVLELKLVVAKIMSQYTVKLSSKTELPIKFSPTSFVLLPENGLWFEFYKRLKL